MRRATMLAAALALAACRPDPGAPNYPNPGVWDPSADDPDFVQSDDPFEEGDERLSLGVFYEGGASESLGVDNQTRHLYIYEGTFSLGATDNRYEGLSADELEITGAQVWWGGGIHWDEPTDLSDWTTLHFALASRDPSFERWTIGMGDGIVEARINVADLGFVADGSWQSIDLPLADLSGLDLTQISIALQIVGESGTAGDTLLIDDLYFSKD